MKTIGIIALSGECDKEKVENAKNYFEKEGYKVKLSSNIFDKERYSKPLRFYLHKFFEGY